MSADFIQESFEGLDELYPGSKRTRRSVETETTRTVRVSSPLDWDVRPYQKMVNGQSTELFAIGSLAAALNRPLTTIRLWTRTGKLPQATYRLPTRFIDIVDADGKVVDRREQKGRRLYTRAQIEAVIRLAEAHDILHRQRIEWSEHEDFALQVADAWQELAS